MNHGFIPMEQEYTCIESLAAETLVESVHHTDVYRVDSTSLNYYVEVYVKSAVGEEIVYSGMMKKIRTFLR